MQCVAVHYAVLQYVLMIQNLRTDGSSRSNRDTTDKYECVYVQVCLYVFACMYVWCRCSARSERGQISNPKHMNYHAFQHENAPHTYVNKHLYVCMCLYARVLLFVHTQSHTFHINNDHVLEQPCQSNFVALTCTKHYKM